MQLVSRHHPPLGFVVGVGALIVAASIGVFARLRDGGGEPFREAQKTHRPG